MAFESAAGTAHPIPVSGVSLPPSVPGHGLPSSRFGIGGDDGGSFPLPPDAPPPDNHGMGICIWGPQTVPRPRLRDAEADGCRLERRRRLRAWFRYRRQQELARQELFARWKFAFRVGVAAIFPGSTRAEVEALIESLNALNDLTCGQPGPWVVHKSRALRAYHPTASMRNLRDFADQHDMALFWLLLEMDDDWPTLDPDRRSHRTPSTEEQPQSE